MTEGARRAGPQDADRCFEMYAAAVGELGGRRGGPLLARQAIGGREFGTPADLAAVFGDPGYLNLVGTYDGVVVGMAQGQVEREEGGALLGRINAYYVEPQARGVGVGEALLESVLAWFAEQGCAGVDALALPGDRGAKRFFEAKGFKARLLVLHRGVEDPQAGEGG